MYYKKLFDSVMIIYCEINKAKDYTFTLLVKLSVLLFPPKGPFINYVTLLGGGGGSHLCYGLLRRGGGVLAEMLRNAKM